MPNLDSSRWPVDPESLAPLPPRPQPGYYPGYSTLSQQSFWDEATRKVVLKRVNEVPPIRFFSPEEGRLMEAICARILPQDDRDEDHQIPILNRVDERLYENRGDGYRFESMPPDQEAYHLGLQGIGAIAREMFDRSFFDLGPLEQDHVLKTLHDGKPPAAPEIWKRMPAHRFWLLMVKDIVEVYYSHPWAWDEIGFGGPAYPRAYMRLENGQPEPWEVQEQRYEWMAPETSLSGGTELVAGTSEHLASPGQAGTH